MNAVTCGSEVAVVPRNSHVPVADVKVFAKSEEEVDGELAEVGAEAKLSEELPGFPVEVDSVESAVAVLPECCLAWITMAMPASEEGATGSSGFSWPGAGLYDASMSNHYPNE